LIPHSSLCFKNIFISVKITIFDEQKIFNAKS
jgi:hypothetical protein